MYFFNPPLVEYAVDYFRRMDNDDAARGDEFWQLFGPGNTLYFSDRPFERLSDYEEMLAILQNADRAKYLEMHKGTPFYLMAWLAFDLRNYKKALFYIDSAISEDVRRSAMTQDSQSWKQLPGARFLLLEPGREVAERAITAVRTALDAEISRFNAISGSAPITIDTVLRFAREFIDGLHRTIVSTLYIFVMESEERFQQLRLREGSSGGSNEPFTVHLFTGGLLLESMLKHYYPKPPGHGGPYTVGSIFHRNDFRRDFALVTPPSTSADTLREIFEAAEGSFSAEVAFSTAAKLRNTTGHNLIWDDVFAETTIYEGLCNQVLNAILYVIEAKA